MPYLPPLKPGKVWGVRIYPGGRREFRQCEPAELMTYQEANEALVQGRKADMPVQPLNEVCEHGCHIDERYGFVVMGGCPIHD